MTSDVVAVMELVKNSYDALATRVEIRIHTSTAHNAAPYIEILDDGVGMDYEAIRDVWCVVATPFRHKNPVSSASGMSRAATGDKGLGRLSAARLGRRFKMVTKPAGGPALEFSLSWTEMFGADDATGLVFPLKAAPARAIPNTQGTLIRISGLNEEWTREKIDKLRANLSRFVSPFASKTDFSLLLDAPESGRETSLEEIQPPAFMSQPKYSIEGTVDQVGTVRWTYRYRPLDEEGRTITRHEDWPALRKSLLHEGSDRLSPDAPGCGPFEFDVRAWDLTVDDTRDIADHFQESRSHIRAAIKSQWGISVYRDDVLVLPKSAAARDWLGMDIRRISKVGTRLSTSQVVGCVRITKAKNPFIVDTSDRESLASNNATLAFRLVLRSIVFLLEDERDQDRIRDTGKTKDLFADLSADALVEELDAIRSRKGSVDEAVKVARSFGERLDKSRARIERRFGYYNRLAVIGTIAQLVIHEIRNRTTAIGRGLDKVAALVERFGEATSKKAVRIADGSVEALETLADRFAPLASRGYRPGRRTSVLEESIARCLDLQQAGIRSHGISVETPPTASTQVRVDPGELDAIMLNLISNSVYWLARKPGDRRLRFRLEAASLPERVRVFVDDSGLGIDPEDKDRVFWPGVTRKPNGIGMGLTVASELVDAHGGRMRTTIPGELGGATFDFDVPLVKDGFSR
ncbi:MAG: sensor histidine kinase [Acidobacteria bacterium]|nr:sensor histidine kinase [Acidobacteriota bacterium]